MKAIILASEPKELKPATDFVPKALIPIANIPLVVYTLKQLRQAGVDKVALTCLNKHLDRFKLILGEGSMYGVQITYYPEEEFTDLVTSIERTKGFLEDSDFSFIVEGDTLVEGKLEAKKGSPQVYLSKVNEEEAKHHLVALIDRRNLIEGVEDKSDEPYSYTVLTGLNVFTSGKLVYEVASQLKPDENGKRSFVEYLNVFAGKTNLKPVITDKFFSRVRTHEQLGQANLWGASKVFRE